MIFLRPWFLLALLIPFFIKGVHRFAKEETPWAKFIDKKLLPTLLIKEKEGRAAKARAWLAWGLWTAWCVALAGPALYKLPVPAVESAPNTIVVFDLGMQGKALLQGQAKLYDLLTALKGERVGLVLFGQNRGYTAMPLTPDISLVKEIVPTLTASVLPEPALNPENGFQYAAELLDNAGAKGRILYVTDKPQKWQGRYPFGVLDLTKRTADTSDIENLLNLTKKAQANISDNAFTMEADTWADLGGWIVLISLPFLALMFRKGVLFLALFLMTPNVQAGFLWRPDQEVYHNNQKGMEAYQKKDYPKAVNAFQQAGHLYNLGNALAFQGDIQGAIDAYRQELEKNPDNQDAQFNKEYLEKQLTPPEDQAKQSEEGESQDNKNDSDENSNQEQKDNQEKSQGNDSEGNGSEEHTENQEQNSQEAQSENQPTQEGTQAELEQALAEYSNESPYNQEEQQIINRLNHDPSRVLRYRLMLQHQKGNKR